MSRTSKKSQYIDEVKRLYIENLKSLSEISQLLGPSVQTLSRWLGEEGIELAARPRNPNAGRSEDYQREINERIAASQRNRIGSGGQHGGRKRVIAREARSCENPACEEIFEAPVNSPQRFCGLTCARSVDNKDRWADKRKMTTCPCGEVFYSPYPKKYHSDECREKYALRRQADPANTLIAVCQNPGCPREGRQFTYPKSQGHRRYCSDKCSQEHTRPNEQLNGLESAFKGLCYLMEIGCRRPEGDEQIPWGDRGSYAPDFICEWRGEVIAVETKGDHWVKEDTEPKHTAWRVQRGLLAVLFEEDLQTLRTAPSADQFWAMLRYRATSGSSLLR
jgi:hypothetical protein